MGEVETTGRRSVTSLSGLRRDSEVMYVGTFSAGPQQRGNVANVFTETEEARKSTLTRFVLFIVQFRVFMFRINYFSHQCTFMLVTFKVLNDLFRFRKIVLKLTASVQNGA